jgi:AcrR family transcriptional regulator
MTKQEILEKIEPLFFQKSFKEISMQEIADTLEMKKASLYYHFPSKESLI